MASEGKCGWCPLGYSGCSQYRELEQRLNNMFLNIKVDETTLETANSAMRLEVENHDLRAKLEHAENTYKDDVVRHHGELKSAWESEKKAWAEADRLRESLWVLAYPPWTDAAPGLRSWVLNQVRSGIPLLDPEQREELRQHLEGPDRFIRNEPGGELCVKCGKHIREHYGGTEYRCYPKEEA